MNEAVARLVLFSGLALSIALIFYARTRTTCAARQFWMRACVTGIGASFLCFGAYSLFAVYRSERPTVHGQIADLRQFSGKFRSSDFEVVGSDGAVDTIHSRYNGPALKNGTAVQVRFIRYDRALLDLVILSGPAAGWQLHEDDETLAALVLLLLGLTLLLTGRLAPETWILKRRSGI